MADAAYLEHSTPMAHVTLGDVLDFIGFVMGTPKDNLDPTERAVWVQAVNHEMAMTRLRGKMRGWGAMHVDIDWTAGNAREELPADFAELRSGAMALRLDADGNVSDTLQIYTEDEANMLWKDAKHPTDWRSLTNKNEVLILENRTSENLRRFIRVMPTPDATATPKYRIPYWARVEKLVNDDDVIEAPPELAVEVKFAAAKLVALVRNPGKMQTLSQLEEEAHRRITSPEGRETPKAGVVLPFESYDDFKHGLRTTSRSTQ